MDQLRRRLEETEKAMERIMAQMGNVSEKLSPSAIAEILNSSPATTCQDKVQRVYSIRIIQRLFFRRNNNAYYYR